MGVSLELDKRYKVTKEVLRQMKSLEKAGYSYNRIAEVVALSPNTVSYWLDKDYREKQRKANSLRKYPNNKKRVEQNKTQKKMFRLDYALGYIAKQVNSHQYKKGDVLILGVSMRKHWIPYLKSEYQKGSRKLGL